MSSEPRKRVIVVVGMHRSGTSALTRGLQALGVELGERLMPPLPANNEKGFFEDIDATDLDIEIHRALGRRDWHSIAPFTREELHGERLAHFRERAVALLRERLEGVSRFGLKDPRISTLLPFWKGVLGALDADAAYVICVRNPLSVAHSVRKRDGIDAERSHYLWLEHTALAVLETEGARRTIVDYDLMMREPAAQLARIAQALDLDFDAGSPAAAEYAGVFLTEDLRSSVHTLGDLRSAPNVPAEVVSGYEILRQAACDALSPDAREIHDHFAAARKTLDAMRPALAYMARKDDEVADLSQALRSAGAPAGQLGDNAQFLHLQATVAELQAELANRETELKWWRAELERRDRILGLLEHRLATRLGAFFEPYPTLRAIFRAPLRLLSRIGGSSSG